MGLSKKQKRRIQGYLDMLEYNSDVISLMSDDVRLDRGLFYKLLFGFNYIFSYLC